METLTDSTDNSLTYSDLYAGIDIAGTVGSNNAWVGLTAGNGAGSATQVITNFTYTRTPEPATLTLLAGGLVAMVRRRRR